MKTQNPIIGRAKGSAGGMTAAKVYDKNVLRAKAMEVNNPKTAAQVTQRDFFAQVQAIASTVTNEQLRSLFGTKPKAMSRRNALAAQIAEAYSIDGTTKSVDFSKLGRIGNGEKVTTPYVEFTNGTATDSTLITAAMLNVAEGQDPNIILIAFDSVNNKIIILNLENILSDMTTTADLVDEHLPDLTGFAYVTCESKGRNVFGKSFGSFIIKVRAEKKSSSGSKGSADTDIAVTLASASAEAAVTLDFSNYDFNNLQPGELYQDDGTINTTLVESDGWIEGTDNVWSSEIIEDFNSSKPTFLSILQGDVLIDTVPVTVTIG